MSNLKKDTSNHISHSNYVFSEYEVGNQYTELQDILEKRSHVLIVFLGALIGGILSLFISYHLHTTFMFFIFLSILPICCAYILRKVYINTIIKID